MTRMWIAAAIGVVILGMGAVIYVQRASLHATQATVDYLEGQLASARAQIAYAAEAAAVHRAHIERMQEEANRAADQGRALQALEGRDAPLSDTLRDAADIMFGPR